MVDKNLRQPQVLLVMYLSRIRSLSSRLKQRKIKVFHCSSISSQDFSAKISDIKFLEKQKWILMPSEYSNCVLC